MDKRELYDSFVNLEQNTQQMLAKIDEMKTDMTQILERNAELEIENQHLREHLEELQTPESEAAQAKRSDANGADDKTPQLSKSRANLEKLYEEGFHVCYLMYGSRRIDDEPCAFCLDVIYGERH
ncbi:initiation-control protein [Loigolactobacillus backii]|uniref:Replication initiation control protein YabA n=1 Tax=Loigolactobacillus backii TaxID=375175 RepID=A0A192H3G0_9LACO|nr:DNA replication initiation control protein YabA [Loigolactobacillus backii]ANK62496.1 initiation-control protein [Loigolactobacillus backii]ANK70492.1 initiation-control protein [Loigolactobacillus backii]